jgi:hypothetical protein
MSFAGHVLDMMKRQAMNRALQKKYREKYAQLKETNLSKPLKGQFNEAKFPKKSEEKIEQSRKRVRLQIEKERQMALLKTFLMCLALMAALIFLFKK